MVDQTFGQGHLPQAPVPVDESAHTPKSSLPDFHVIGPPSDAARKFVDQGLQLIV